MWYFKPEDIIAEEAEHFLDGSKEDLGDWFTKAKPSIYWALGSGGGCSSDMITSITEALTGITHDYPDYSKR